MADTFTAKYNLTKPEPGAPGWDNKLNDDLDAIDQQLAASEHKDVWALPAFQATYLNALNATVPGDQTAVFRIGRPIRYNTVGAPSTYTYRAVTTVEYDAVNDRTKVGIAGPPNNINELYVSILGEQSGLEGGYPADLDAWTLRGKNPNGEEIALNYSGLSPTTPVDLDFNFGGSSTVSDAFYALYEGTDPYQVTMVVRDNSGGVLAPFIGGAVVSSGNNSIPALPGSGILRVRLTANSGTHSGSVKVRKLRY